MLSDYEAALARQDRAQLKAILLQVNIDDVNADKIIKTALARPTPHPNQKLYSFAYILLVSIVVSLLIHQKFNLEPPVFLAAGIASLIMLWCISPLIVMRISGQLLTRKHCSLMDIVALILATLWFIMPVVGIVVAFGARSS